MDCDNVFCIYCEKGKCVLEKISLDIQGNCQDCVYVEIENSLLEFLKKEQRND